MLATALPEGNPALIELKAEEARHLQSELWIAEEGRSAAVGSTASVGICRPALMSCLLSVPLLVSRDPRVASAFIALLNRGAVGGCHYLASRYFGKRAALSATLLYSINPWAM